jgi:hypothetical protein
MGAKYAKGTKVRIKARDFPGTVFNPEIQRYQNMVGEILDSIDVVAFLSAPRGRTGGDWQVTIYNYKVKINERVTLSDVTEDYLEIIQ